jgi:hypothetical protein
MINPSQFDRVYKTVTEQLSREKHLQALKTLAEIKPFEANTPEIEREYVYEYDSGGLMGYVETTYDKLVEVFGEPVEGGDKTTAEWYIKFSDGQMANIYDYKTDYTPKYLFPWHVGGKTTEILEKVASLVGGEPTQLGY